MPLYEYECESCEHITTIKLFKYKPTKYLLKLCDCGGRYKLRMSSNNFRLKGDGWGEDGYNKAGNNQ